jgi:hypothetical protein
MSFLDGLPGVGPITRDPNVTRFDRQDGSDSGAGRPSISNEFTQANTSDTDLTAPASGSGGGAGGGGIGSQPMILLAVAVIVAFYYRDEIAGMV